MKAPIVTCGRCGATCQTTGTGPFAMADGWVDVFVSLEQKELRCPQCNIPELPSDPKLVREQLRSLMAECPACVPEEADLVADADLRQWVFSHGAVPVGEVQTGK